MRDLEDNENCDGVSASHKEAKDGCHDGGAAFVTSRIELKLDSDRESNISVYLPLRRHGMMIFLL